MLASLLNRIATNPPHKERGKKVRNGMNLGRKERLVSHVGMRDEEVEEGMKRREEEGNVLRLFLILL